MQPAAIASRAVQQRWVKNTTHSPEADTSCDGLADLQLAALLLDFFGEVTGRHGRTMVAAPIRLAWMARAEPRWSYPVQVAETTIPDDLPGKIPELVSTVETWRQLLAVTCGPVWHGLCFTDERSSNRQLEQLVVDHVQTNCCGGWVAVQISKWAGLS